ncbi:uncharacterized protein PV07_12115 [Cladophialophora immunda]|uniref:Uncharacterized protein n=1 Tax=Cladophialophora immunda TaxID=569365 RepID=A0A0D2CF57_9EURO|nr:uncharacterized protein PV07_12115 [Cladophialophora immunda]KIW22204.1 hypothetical protein PV07_12115 [Cladophialophora immunda]
MEHSKPGHRDEDLPRLSTTSQVPDKTVTDSGRAQHVTWGSYQRFDAWGRLVTDYTRRELTYESDKLLAIEGLKNLVNVATRDQELAGLWRSHMPRALLWRRPFKTRFFDSKRNGCLCPSWSWASVAGPIAFSDSSENTGFEDECVQIVARIVKYPGQTTRTPKGIDTTNTALRIQAPLLEIGASDEGIRHFLPVDGSERMDSRPTQGKVYFTHDYSDALDRIDSGDSTAHKAKPERLRAAIIQTRPSKLGTSFGIEGLVLIRAEGFSENDHLPLYERIGYFMGREWATSPESWESVEGSAWPRWLPKFWKIFDLPQGVGEGEHGEDSGSSFSDAGFDFGGATYLTTFELV